MHILQLNSPHSIYLVRSVNVLVPVEVLVVRRVGVLVRLVRLVRLREVALRTDDTLFLTRSETKTRQMVNLVLARGQLRGCTWVSHHGTS